MDIVTHYDRLIEENNDPFRDEPSMRDYMDKWDGQLFVDAMHLTNNKRVLEIGVGTGRIAKKVAQYCRELIGIDISPKTISRAKENLAELTNIKFICDDFMTYFFAESFDIVYASLTLMHFQNKIAFFKKVNELLVNDGILCLSIDKNMSDSIDMGTYKLNIYPDNLDDTLHYIAETGMSINEVLETEFAYIIVSSKRFN